MAFWDDIAKGVTDAANYTVKKTEELTSFAKTKIALRSEEAKLAECYEQIGRLYYSYQRKNKDHTEEIASLLSSADEIKCKISHIKAELAKLQKSVICASCGEQISNEAVFCPVCGKKQTEDEAE